MTRRPGHASPPSFRVWMREDGIVELVWSRTAQIHLAEAVAAGEAIAELAGERPVPLLVDTRNAGPQDREARAEFVRRGSHVTAVALIVGSPMSRILGNLYINVSRPAAPTRLFDAEGPAAAWLASAAR